MGTRGVSNAKTTMTLNDTIEANKFIAPDADASAGVSPKETKVHNGKAMPQSDVAQGVDNQYFFEDEVFRIDKKGNVKFGLVIETIDSFSDDEDEDLEELLKKGEVRVAWHPDGTEDLHYESTLGLADRTLMPGDVVRRMVPGKDTQRGYCREIEMHADVRVIGTKYVIKNVHAKRLRLISSWQRDSAVCLDSWVGSTKDSEEKAVLKSATGCRVEISSPDFFGFKDSTSRYLHGVFSPQVFYTGNHISGRVPENAKLLTPNIPLPKNKKGKPSTAKYVVESVRTESVWVHWQCKALSDGSDLSPSYFQQPNSLIAGDDLKRLKRLNLFEACMLQINDRTYLKYSQDDVVIKKSQWDKEQSNKYKLIFDKQQKEENQNFFVHNISSSSNPSHHDKIKKRVSLESEKTAKLKKSSQLKTDKSNKDKPKSEGTAVDSSKKSQQDPDWVSEDDDDKDSKESLNEDGVSTTTASTCSSPSPRATPRHNFKVRPSKLKIKSFKKSVANLKPSKSYFAPKDGNELITETLLVYSTVTVVWQDGTEESGIASTDLYPIHHLDNNEFFPGDFVILNEDSDTVSNFRDYGVIQKVDHTGRTALVKWFTTYTTTDKPEPTYNGESEVSVYDLKDHPDFQYRPGTMVIRVANFVGDDANSTAGQIMDNFVDGRVKVWWVDGHISMCWPQDLFEVGQQDTGEWGGDSEEESWETESENSEIGGSGSPKVSIAETQLLSNIERVRVDIARLEEIFRMSPKCQSSEVMRKLLSVYKGCRYFDRLMNTNFFHESNFMGLVERVRKGGSQSIFERAQDRKNRLFSQAQDTKPNAKLQQTDQAAQVCFQAIISVNGTHNPSLTPTKEYAPKVIFNFSSTPSKSSLHICSSGTVGGNNCNLGKRKNSGSASSIPKDSSANDKPVEAPTSRATLQAKCEQEKKSIQNTAVGAETSTSVSPVPASNVTSPGKEHAFMTEKEELLNSAILNIEKAFETTSVLAKKALMSKDDSGNFSRNENLSDSCASITDLENADEKTSLSHVPNQSSVSCSSIEFADDAPEFVCGRMCSLLKEQLLKCIEEIREKYYKDDAHSNLTCDCDEEEKCETPTGAANNLAEDDGHGDNDNDVNDTDNVNEKFGDAKEERERTPEPMSPVSTVPVTSDHFEVVASAPNTHKYHLTIFHPNNPQSYYRAVQREHRMLTNSLPPGVWVKVFEDRMDLLSVMIEGPKKTPYEDAMFLFDIQLGREYPLSPPLCYYISYCSDRLNPNLYEDGKVCVSLLGTWSGRDNEVWGPNSTLLQVIVSIQGLILVPEPYFNEAGYEKQKGSQEGKENSRMYNEMAIIKVVQATTKLMQKPPPLFHNQIVTHFKANGRSMHDRIQGWIELSKLALNTADRENINADAELPSNCAYNVPDFPLIPASRGFCLSLAGLLEAFALKLNALESMKEIMAEECVPESADK